MKPNQPVTVTTGQHRGETGTVTGRTGALWSVRLSSGKTVVLAATSLRRGAA